MKYSSPTGEDTFFNNQLLSPPGDDKKITNNNFASGR